MRSQITKFKARFAVSSLSDEELTGAALAYMEQYGVTVGNALATLISDAGKRGDMELVADLLTIIEVIADISDHDIEITKAPAVARFALN